MTSGLGVLSSNSETPVMSQTSVSTDLLETLQILTKFVVKNVSHDLGGLAILGVSLSVQEPIRDLVLSWVLKLKLLNN